MGTKGQLYVRVYVDIVIKDNKSIKANQQFKQGTYEINGLQFANLFAYNKDYMI